jgi:predicted dehydrogenase
VRLNHILFVGLGGAGQRHLRILRALLPEARMSAFRSIGRTPVLNPDFSVAAERSLTDDYGIEMWSDFPAALAQQPDLVVIATPTALHRDPTEAAVRAGIGVLVEKPWSASGVGFAAFAALVYERNVPFRISFQRRHHPLLRRVHDLVAGGVLGKIISAQFLVGSFVPSWHPYEDWRALYAVRTDLGGGVLLTECHEIDLCHWFFGPPQRVHCAGGNFGPEPLDVEDTAQLTLDYGDFPVQISLSFMQRRPRRRFEIAGASGHVLWEADGNMLVHADYRTGQMAEQTLPDLGNDALFESQAGELIARFDTSLNEENLHAAWACQAVIDAARESMQSHAAVDLPNYPNALSR